MKIHPILFSAPMVRIERVQDISEEDACFEGFLLPGGHQRGLGVPAMCPHDDGVILPDDSTICREWFRTLWDSINLKRGHGWDKNDPVWVIEYEPCERPKGFGDANES